MAKRYRGKLHPIYEYVEIMSDPVGMVLQITKGASVGHRFWVNHADASRFYEEILPEKWLVLKEWSRGHVTVDGPAIDGTGYAGYFTSRNMAEDWVGKETYRLLPYASSDLQLGRYVYKIIKVPTD